MSNLRRLVLELLADDSKYNRTLDKAPQTAKQAGLKSGTDFTQGFDSNLNIKVDDLRRRLEKFIEISDAAGKESGRRYGLAFLAEQNATLNSGQPQFKNAVEAAVQRINTGGIRLVSDVPAGYVGVPVSTTASSSTDRPTPKPDRDPFQYAQGVKVPTSKILRPSLAPAKPDRDPFDYAPMLLGITGNTGRSSGPHLDVRYSRAYNPDRPRVSDEVLNRLMVDDKPLTSYPITSEHRSRNGGRPTHDGVDFGTPVGGKITTKVPVVYRSKPEWDNGGGGWITTVRFADGVEIVLLHQDPSVKDQLTTEQGGRAAPTYQTQEKQAQKQEDEARKIIEQARRRGDERRQQANEQQRLALEDTQKTEVLKQEQAIATMPPGGRKETAELFLRVTQKQNQYALERLQIEQTIAQLKEERTRKLEDQETGEAAPTGDYTSGRRLTRKLDGKNPSGYLGGRDHSDAIAFLEKRKSLLEQNLFGEMKILAGEFEQKLSVESVKLTERLETATKAVEGLQLKFADDTHENRMKQAIAGVSKEFDTQTKTLDEVKKQLEEQVKAKQILGWSTAKEMEQLKQLQALYETLNPTKAKAVQQTRQEVGIVEKQRELKEQSALYGAQTAILNARANVLETNGDTFGANALRERADLMQEVMRRTNEIAQINIEFKGQDTIIAQLTRDANELSQINIEAIADKYKNFGETVGAEIGSAFNGLIQDLKNTSNPLDLLLNLLNRLADSLLQIGLNALNLPKLLGNLLGGVSGLPQLSGGAINAALPLIFKHGGAVPNYASGGVVMMDAIAQAMQREGPNPVLAVLHANEHVLTDLTGEAQRYRSLESRFGSNPLRLISNYATGGMVRAITGMNDTTPTANIAKMDLRTPTVKNSNALSVNVGGASIVLNGQQGVDSAQVNKFAGRLREEMAQVAAGMVLAEFDQRGMLNR